MVAEIGTFWKLDPLAAYQPNLKDGLYPVVRPTRGELAGALSVKKNLLLKPPYVANV